MKKIFVTILCVAGFLAMLPAASVRAEETKLNFYFFWGNGCPHCAKEEILIEDLKARYPQVHFYDFEIYYHPENVKLMQAAAQALGVDVGGVPFTIIGDKPFVGFSEDISPKQLEDRIQECLNNGYSDSIAQIVGVPLPAAEQAGPRQNLDNQFANGSGQQNQSSGSKKFHVPVLGEIDAKTVSLPLLTVVIGLLDGFNPCAMWTLLFLISLLLGMQDRKRMWILGSAFIITSGSVYFMFMAAWLNLILFLGFVIWVRAIIGVVAVGGGSYSLREFFKNKDGGCKVTGGEDRQRIFQKLKNITQQKSFWLALGGIIVLAFAVNLVELICSAGFPAVYTQVLALGGLAKWQYYLYILGYIFFFMLDDMIVFIAAMITLQMTGITTKYGRYSNLIGGILMVIIGLLLIFRPSWLMFG